MPCDLSAIVEPGTRGARRLGYICVGKGREGDFDGAQKKSRKMYSVIIAAVPKI